VFLERATALEATTVVREQVGSQLKMSWKQGEPLQWRSTEPLAELLDSVLLRLRPFILNEDPAFLTGIHNICHQRLRSDTLRGQLVEIRTRWRAAQRTGILALRINERDLAPEYVMRLWINGWYFHSDPELTAELEQLAPEAHLLTRHVFLDYVYRAIESALRTAAVVRAGLAGDLFDR
jgi:hypothetical protein